MGKIKFALPLFFIVFFFFTASVSLAHYRERVLGVATSSSQIKFPEGNSYGPGFFLPDSPLYGFDLLWQKTRLTFTADPVRKAHIRASIAGERIAELNAMLSKNDLDAINVVLARMEKEARVGSNELNASEETADVTQEAAKILNEAIKAQRSVLLSLVGQTDSELSLKLRGTRETLLRSKLTVEDELPESMLKKEMEREFEAAALENLEYSEELTREAESNLNALGKL